MYFLKKRPTLVAFLIPFTICILICIIAGVYPFGSRCLLHMDLYHQYLPFFTELRNKILNGGSLMYSWNVGLGSDFVSVYAYYLASPLNWLVVLFPKNHVIEFMEILILLKIALSGASFFYFLREHYTKKYSAITYVFSTAYAFSGFVAAYSWNIMWMDVVALAPLVIVGSEKLVKDKKPSLYYCSLSLAIICNYYLCIMLCIFLVFYFLWLFIKEKQGRIFTIIRFGTYSLLAGATGAVMMIPEMKILSYSGSASMSFPKKMEWYFNLMSEVGRMCATSSSYNGAGNWPNLYAGTFSIVLVLLYLFNTKISWRSKILPLSMIGIFSVSFANNYLDFIWHGLHFPDSLPARQSYLFVFVILCVGYRALLNWKGIPKWTIAVAAVISLMLIVISGFYQEQTVTDWYSIIIGVLFVLVYSILMGLVHIASKKNRSGIIKFACGMAIVELTLNMATTGLGTTSRTDYTANENGIEKALELASEDAQKEGNLFYRIEDTERLTKNDDCRYGYASGTQFSSLMNINVSHFYQRFYMEGGKNFYCYNGATPITSSMLSVKYFISDSDELESPLKTMVGKADDHYLYKNNYCLPVGFMMSERSVNNLENSVNSKIGGINSLSYILGANDEMLSVYTCNQEVSEGITTLEFDEDGYYYASYIMCDADTLTFEHNNTSTKYSKTTHKYLFDLGQIQAGETVEVSNTQSEEIRFNVYKLNMEAVETSYDTLSGQTFNVTEFSDTRVCGTIDAQEAGRLIFSIPKEEGWTVYVDDEKVKAESFSDTFLSVHVSSGTHEVRLVYETPGLMSGIKISVASIGLFAMLQLLRKFFAKKRFFR